MPSTILSDNGASSGSAGLKSTAGNDGVLILQTTTSGGTATNALYINNTQNVGVSVTPSAWSGRSSLQLGDSGYFATTGPNLFAAANTYYNGTNSIYVADGYASRMRLTGGGVDFGAAASGSLGGTISFTTTLSVNKDTTLALQGATSVSGTGITFPATQSASSNANTLDDYEEGTWTPLLNGSVSMGTARYIKIGQLVFCEIAAYNLNVSSIGASTGLSIEGAPFSMTTYQYAMPIAQQAGVNYGFYDSSGTSFYLGVGGTAVDVQAVSRNTLGGSGNISFRFSFTYRANT